MKDLKSPRKIRTADHINNLPKSGIREFFELVIGCDDVISLGVGEPDFVTPWTIRESAIYSLERGHTSYTSNKGLLSLRKEVCKYVSEDYGVQYDAENECLITVGVSEALDLAMRAVIDPGDEVIYCEPCFVSYAAEIAMAHGVPVAIENHEGNEFSLDIEVLKSKITPKTKALLLNFPCNPTGATLSMQQMEDIAEIAIENDIIVITDEIYTELTYEERLNSIASLPGMKERTIFLHGFSKAFAMTGFRIGYACGPEDLIDAMNKIHQYMIMCASINAQEAAIEALKNGRQAMEKMRDEYRERRNLIVKGFNDIGLTCLKPKGSFYVFPNITSTGLTSAEFARRLLEEEKVAVVPGDAFGACGEGYVRACYAASASHIMEALQKTGDFVRRLKQK
ncbi:aminotransferase class I/II-fold pyridoxal phosphate-dependent enzyme [Lentisphaerota bacterium ZTH]|nr:aminotransferase class I/II-fold pyridoxal phosphate-dependent enzyme [Lentisphaerota bacterium]WET06376.1 aminotransferase class I/II-fold pyridoxal phosphate-dependent enzyme [Lentisphaerota bacterium ZTH]